MSETVGKVALIFATCISISPLCVKLVSIFLIGVGDPIVISPNRFVVALMERVDIGVFKSYARGKSYFSVFFRLYFHVLI